MASVTMTKTRAGAAATGARKRRPRAGKALLYAVLTVGAVAMIAPFVWMLLSSLKSPSEVNTFSWLPKTIRFENYSEALKSAPFGTYFRNSLFLAIGQAALTLTFATAAGYALARTPMRGRGLLLGFVVAMIMVPFQVILVPEFLIVKSMPFFGGNDIFGQGGTGWLNTWFALIIPHAIAPIYVFLARQFFVSLPEELADAARVDGLSEYGIFLRIMLPLIKPALVTITVLQVEAAWNSFLWPLLVTSRDDLRPIQVGLAIFAQDPLNIQWPYLMAGATLATLPMILLFVVAQRYFVEGFASAGIKG
jgi:multiple sugar transport system permease protein